MYDWHHLHLTLAPHPPDLTFSSLVPLKPQLMFILPRKYSCKVASQISLQISADQFLELTDTLGDLEHIGWRSARFIILSGLIIVYLGLLCQSV